MGLERLYRAAHAVTEDPWHECSLLHVLAHLDFAVELQTSDLLHIGRSEHGERAACQCELHHRRLHVPPGARSNLHHV